MLAAIVFATVMTGGSLRGMPPLSSLNAKCSFSTSALGLTRKMLMLQCGGRPVRIVAPQSMTGNVKIVDERAALEFVRFFSTRMTFAFVLNNGFVEVGDEHSELDSHLFFVMTRPAPWFTLPKVTKFVGEFGDTQFEVKRLMLSVDGNVYKTTETVTTDGDYRFVGCDRVATAQEAGLVHPGEI